MLANQENEIEIKSSSKLGQLIGTFLVLIAIVIYMFLARPLGGTIGEIKADITTKNTEITTIKGQLDDFSASKNQLGLESQELMDSAVSAIPVGVNQDDIIRDVIVIAGENDINLNSISFGKGASDLADVQSLRISASFVGNYTDLVAFLKGLEANKRVFRINNISVQLNELDITEFQRATFSLAMEAFYQ